MNACNDCLDQYNSHVAEVKALMKAHGITVDQLKSKRGAPKGTRIAVKYKDESGHAWSGRGLTPAWMKEAIATGATKDSFKVTS